MTRRHDQPVDVLFINPPSPDCFIYIRDINRCGRSSWERMVWPQTSLAILAAVAEQQGLSVDIIDCIGEGIKWPEFEVLLGKCRPRYCFSNVISATYSNDVKALRRTKEISGAVTVGMGPHLTDSPGRSLLESEALDFVIRNEAEESLREILQTCEAGRPLSVERLSRIAGIGFVPARLVAGASSTPVITARRPFLDNLDDLPRPRHDLLPLDKYWAPLLGHYTFIEASRGCPYQCTFCRQAVMYERKFRTRSGESLAEEVLYLHLLGVRKVMFHAEIFTLDRGVIEDLCDRLIAAGSPVQWACNTHVKCLLGKPDLVKKMRRAGCWMLAIGIESADDEILRNIRKGCTAAEAAEVVRMIDAVGIEAWGYMVIGFPGETRDTIDKTIRFALQLPLKIAKFDIGAPYPGTEFGKWAQEQGLLRVERYEQFDQNASAVVEYPHLSRAEIKAAVRRATRRFYLRPKTMLRVLKECFKPGGIKAVLLIIRDRFRLLAGPHPKRAKAAEEQELTRKTADLSSCIGSRPDRAGSPRRSSAEGAAADVVYTRGIRTAVGVPGTEAVGP